MSRETWTHNLSRYILLGVIFGVVTTLIRYEGFGQSDQIEQIPLILRSIDHQYLQNDFFVNASAGSIARRNYSMIVAALAGSVGNLPSVSLGLTLAANISISIITFLFARRLFNGSTFSGIAASMLVMSVSTFDLGWTPTIYQTTLVPSTLAVPLIFMAIFAAVYGNVLLGVLLSGIASIFHPLMGLEGGLIILFAFLTLQFARPNNRKKALQLSLLSFGILTPFAIFSVAPQFAQQTINSSLFVYIVAFFRHPHHYIPSSFGFRQYIEGLSFLSATGLAFFWFWTIQENSKNAAKFIIILVTTILLLCIAGYLFVEVFPSRIMVTAQTFRLLFIVKWLGLILIGGMIADLFQKHKILGSTLLISILHPLAVLAFSFNYTIQEWLKNHLSSLSKNLLTYFTVFAIGLILFAVSFPLRDLTLFLVYFLFILLFGNLSKKLLFTANVMGVSFILLGSTFYSTMPLPSKVKFNVQQITNNLAPKVAPKGLGVDGALLAEFARQYTPERSIFLTPPQFGQFRLLAQRAIVVDFKAFPFSDIAIQEWYQRLTDCYGIPNSRGFAMIDELNKNYKILDDHELRSLQERYGFTYAVLFDETRSNFPVVFETRAYKLVEIKEGN